MSALAALLALMLAGGAPAAGASPDMTLTPQRPVSRVIDAYPRIAAPATAETAKINDDLARGDARVKNAARDCNGTASDFADQWRRGVAVPFRYGDLLTVIAADEWACPTFSGSSLMAITYDLTTGQPVDWSKLLLPRVAGDPAQGVGSDTTKLNLVASPILNEVYRRKVLIGMDPEERGSCSDGFASNYQLLLWLDAQREAVVMRGMNFPKAMTPCAKEETLTLEELALLKSEPRLIEALKAAHAAHAWSEEIRPAGAKPKPAR